MSRTISAGYVYRQYSTEGVYIADYKSSRAAHEATGVSIGSIARAAHGERRTGGGYCRLPRYLTKPRQRRSEWDMAGSDGISRVSAVFRGKSLLTNKMRII